MSLPRQAPTANHLGADVTDHLPGPGTVPGTAGFRPEDRAVWELAVEHLHVRSNDVHTAYSYGLAAALCDLHPEADRDVVLPAIILHDTGWSRVPEGEVLEAIRPGGGRHDLVVRHEKEGAAIAAGVLSRLGRDPAYVARVVDIVDGHDTRREALSLDDALVKDADKLWRLTPHGVDTVMDWFGLTREQAHALIGSRVHDHLVTDAARTMARALAAVASVDSTPERVALG
ncbi:HD domain-containing protein [Nocardioides guangzhouensis]|uniref:HD domain-containing protein n=1 Tax=Nocardioides guangzhouensis TaxID=2497878 RepID=A0A4Q4ZIL1_9ACTN|nr:HD domain-containing protein [Nocardioides guangzhouensis]RYP87738.1 HD domain-containing protein [Nocardioides guangzhouensis]